jgi:hypothetical protein
MRARRLWFGLLATLPLVGLPAPAGAQAIGEEFQVNTYTTNNQQTDVRRSVAGDASGNFVVVWRSFAQDGSGDGIFGQRYDSEGTARGSEFRVNSFTTGSQRYPTVAAAAGGDFVVIWEGEGPGDNSGIFGQRYDSTGVAQGAEFRVKPRPQS